MTTNMGYDAKISKFEDKQVGLQPGDEALDDQTTRGNTA